MHILFVIHDPPYGSEKPHQALRLAGAILKVEPDAEVTVYLTADAVLCAKRGQQTPTGYYSIESLLKPVLRSGAVMLCETCLAARGIATAELLEGVAPTKLGELAALTLEADKVLIY